MSGRKLNVLLGQDPDDTNFMDPDNQHFVCYPIKKKADEIKGGDSRLKKKVPGGGVLSAVVNVLRYLTLVGKNYTWLPCAT